MSDEVYEPTYEEQVWADREFDMDTETARILSEIRQRQSNPENTVCVDCKGLIYPRSHHICAVRWAQRSKEAKPWA